jgi:hypothetical protein
VLGLQAGERRVVQDLSLRSALAYFGPERLRASSGLLRQLPKISGFAAGGLVTF